MLTILHRTINAHLKNVLHNIYPEWYILFLGYLQPRVVPGKGLHELCHTFSISSKHSIFNILQCEHLTTNEVAHIVEELENNRPNVQALKAFHISTFYC